MSESSRAVIGAMYGFDAVVRRTADDQRANQSPCEKWDARAVVEHVVFGCIMLGGLAEGADAAIPRDDNDGLLPAMIDGHSIAPWRGAEMGGVDRSGPPHQWWDEQFKIFLERMDPVGGLFTAPALSMWGHQNLEEFLGFGLHDPLCHT